MASCAQSADKGGCSMKRQKSSFVINNSDPGKILNLIVSLTDDSCKDLQIKINNYLTEQCEAELAFQVIVYSERKEAYVETVGSIAFQRKYKLFMSNWMMNILESGPTSKTDYLNRTENLQDPIINFLKDDNPKKRIVMLPINEKPFSLLVCVVAPKNSEDITGSLMQECMAFCWPILKKAIALEFENKLKLNCQQLLKVARNLFIRVGSLPTLMSLALHHAKRLTMAENCCILLIDVEIMQLYEVLNKPDTVQRRFPMNIGITGKVLTTGCLINIQDVKENPDYNPEIDCSPGKDCRSMLCFPIRDSSGIIGVGQLTNKIDDRFFDAMDEEMALGFSIYCGMSIIHSLIYEKSQEAHIRNALAIELLMYHLKVENSDVTSLMECTGYHEQRLESLFYNPRILPLRELPCYVMRMFRELGFIQKFNLKEHKVARFILQVKKSYRDVPYHSWFHAFNTAQWAFSAIQIFKLVEQEYITELHALMYFLSALMHDLDHRGTACGYQIQGQTSLAALYTSEGSVMERHHLTQALCILNTEGCDILESLPRRDYDRALLLLRDNIIATDIQNFLKHSKDYKLIAEVFQKNNRSHLSALQALLMNAADLSDMIKDWDSYKRSTVQILSEYFNQGDDEKSHGLSPFMDTDICIMPELEINFINTVGIPLYEILAQIIPKSAPCGSILREHLEKWDAAIPIFSEVPLLGGFAILQNPDLDNLIDVEIKEKELRQIEEEEERTREEMERLAEEQKAEEKAAAKAARG